MNKNRNISPTEIAVIIAIPVVLGIAYFGIIKPILIKLNIIDSKEEKIGKISESKVSEKQVLSPILFLENKSKITINSAIASQLAKQIYDGKWGGCAGLCDDESKGVGAIQQAGTLVNISYVAYQFNNIYNVGLQTYLESYLEPENWTTIRNFIDNASKY